MFYLEMISFCHLIEEVPQARLNTLQSSFVPQSANMSSQSLLFSQESGYTDWLCETIFILWFKTNFRDSEVKLNQVRGLFSAQILNHNFYMTQVKEKIHLLSRTETKQCHYILVFSSNSPLYPLILCTNPQGFTNYCNSNLSDWFCQDTWKINKIIIQKLALTWGRIRFHWRLCF